MKKIISATLISSVALMLITGCGGSGPSTNHNDPSINENALYVNMHDNKKLIKAINKAGEATGWKITKFKTNALIAEKVDGDHTYASTLKFNDGHIEFENENGTSDGDLDSLRDAIEEYANEKSSY